MKTLLMWGIGSDFSTRAARQLAADGHRLLLVGEDRDTLEALDSGLAQSELHRLTASSGLSDLAAWVQEQNVGLDGLIVFPPAPELNASLLVPRSINLRSADRCLFSVVELIRELLPQLRRGKRPKRILVVLDWSKAAQPTPLNDVLTEAWRAAVPAITCELNKEGGHFNVLCLNESTETPHTSAHLSTNDVEPAASEAAAEPRVIEAPQTSTDADVAQPSEYVQSAVALIAMYFSPTMQFLNGQFFQHPNPWLGAYSVSSPTLTTRKIRGSSL